MSKRFFHIVVSVLAVLAFFSCRKETSIENPLKDVSGTFVAEIDGVHWEAADSMRAAAIVAGVINISGVSADNKQISITLNDTVTGVYALSLLTTSSGLYRDNTSGQSFVTHGCNDTSLAGGQVTVTEIDRVNQTISGTFSFNAYNDDYGKEVKVTNGEFEHIPYTSSLPPADAGDTMSATLNNNFWTAGAIQGIAIDNQLVIAGSSLNGLNAVSLFMPADIVPGSYTLDYSSDTYFAAYFPTVNVSLMSFSGNLVIQEHDLANKRIVGKFDFQAADPTGQGQALPVTGGYFSVQYQ